MGIRLAIKSLLVLSGVVTVCWSLSAFELFGLAFNVLSRGKCNAVFLSVSFQLHGLVQVSVSICAEIPLVGRNVCVTERDLLSHVAVLLDVGFRVSQLCRLRLFAAKDGLSFGFVSFATSERTIEALGISVSQPIVDTLIVVNNNRAISLISGHFDGRFSFLSRFACLNSVFL